MNFLRRLTDRPYLLLTVTTLFWAANAVAGKLAVGHISPAVLTLLRWGLATAFLMTVAVPALRRDWPVIVRHWPFLAVLGILGFTLFNTLFYLALVYTSVIHGAIGQAAMPLVVFLFNFAIFRIGATPLQATGFALTLTGVVLTVTNGNPFAVADHGINIGDFYMMGAVASYGLFSVLLLRKPAMHWLSFLTVLCGFGFVAALPGTALEFWVGRGIWPDTQGWLLAFFTALLPSIVAQAMWIRGIEIIGSNRGGVFINLVPIFATAMAILLLGEAFQAYHAIALVLVISGVWLAQKGRTSG